MHPTAAALTKEWRAVNASSRTPSQPMLNVINVGIGYRGDVADTHDDITTLYIKVRG